MGRSRLPDKAFVVLWVTLVACVAVLAALALIGAWAPGENPGLAVAVVVVLLVLLTYGLWQRRMRDRTPDEQLDRRVVAQRERRGF